MTRHGTSAPARRVWHPRAAVQTAWGGRWLPGQAKQTGASWTEIGEALGVSEQAAQQRHAPGPFERYIDLNRHSMLAQEVAPTHKHDSIGTEHLARRSAERDKE
ncbi:hypothetical protein [Streptomyces formicae]